MGSAFEVGKAEHPEAASAEDGCLTRNDTKDAWGRWVGWELQIAERKIVPLGG